MYHWLFYLWLQKHIVSGPTILQSIPLGAVQLTNSLFSILMGNTFFLYSSYSSGVKSFPPSSSPTILKKKLYWEEIQKSWIFFTKNSKLQMQRQLNTLSLTMVDYGYALINLIDLLNSVI